MKEIHRRRTVRYVATATVVGGLVAVLGLTLPRPGSVHASATGPAGDPHYAPKPLPAPDPAWVRTAANGVTVELLSVAHGRFAETEPTKLKGRDDYQQIESAWTPAGRALNPPLYPDGMGGADTVDVKHCHVLELAFRIGGKFDPQTRMDVLGDERGAVGATMGAALGGGNGKFQQQYPDVFLEDKTFDLRERATNLRVNVAAGDWSIKADDTNAQGVTHSYPCGFGISADQRGAQVEFSSALPDGKGHARFVVTDNVPSDLQARVVAVNEKGKEYRLEQSVQSVGERRQTTVTLDSSVLPFGNVRSLRFELRPYRTVWFKHVALSPASR